MKGLNTNTTPKYCHIRTHDNGGIYFLLIVVTLWLTVREQWRIINPERCHILINVLLIQCGKKAVEMHHGEIVKESQRFRLYQLNQKRSKSKNIDLSKNKIKEMILL